MKPDVVAVPIATALRVEREYEMFCVHLDGTRIWSESEFATVEDAICAVMRTGLSSAYGHKFTVEAVETGTELTSEAEAI